MKPHIFVKTTFISLLITALSSCGAGTEGANPSTVAEHSPSSVNSSSILSTSSSSTMRSSTTLSSNTTSSNPIASSSSAGSSISPINNNKNGGASSVSSSTTIEETQIELHDDPTEAFCNPCETSIHLNQSQVNLNVFGTFNNEVIWLSGGEARFHSSNENVATVDNKGLVTAVGKGIAKINIDIAANGKFLPASAAYTVNVKDTIIRLAPNDVTMSAWIGEKDSLITFPSSADGFTFFSSSDENCDFKHVANCSNGQFDLLNSSALINTATTLNHFGNYLLKDAFDQFASFRMITKEPFAPRTEHQVVNFNNSLFLVGGFLGSLKNLLEPNISSDVWSSKNGTLWSKETVNAGFTTRIGYKVALFNNSLWLIGGNDRKVDYLIPGGDNGRKNDIWSSRDGITWTQQVTHANFSPRNGHSLISFNNKLWIIGGDDKNGYLSDVWSSTNGITWVQQTAKAKFGPRTDHQIIAFNDKLWLIGNNSNDIWSSSDAIEWHQETTNLGFSSRTDHKVVVHNNKLWLVAGFDKNDVWSSTDGITWLQQTEHAAFSPRNNFQLVSFGNKLMVIGGATKEGLNNEVWSSDDGIEWRKGFSGTFQFPQ